MTAREQLIQDLKQALEATPKRLYSTLNQDGDVLMHWRTTEADARHYATLSGNGGWATLVGPRGEILDRADFPPRLSHREPLR